MSVALFGSIFVLCAAAAYGCYWLWQRDIKDGAVAAIGVLLLFVIAMWAWGRATVGYSGMLPLFLLYYVAIPIATSAMLGVTAGLTRSGRGEK
ncbi:MAG: hypothetical protein WBV78_20210 [Roseobacter sp.]